MEPAEKGVIQIFPFSLLKHISHLCSSGWKGNHIHSFRSKILGPFLETERICPFTWTQLTHALWQARVLFLLPGETAPVLPAMSVPSSSWDQMGRGSHWRLISWKLNWPRVLSSLCTLESGCCLFPSQASPWQHVFFSPNPCVKSSCQEPALCVTDASFLLGRKWKMPT